MALRPTHDERKRGDTPGFPLYCPPERIQQACPLFFAALQTRFFNGAATHLSKPRELLSPAIIP